MKRVLIVATSHDILGTSGDKTGLYLSEAIHPYFEFTQNGWEVDFASPRGGKVPFDPASEKLNDERTQRFLTAPTHLQKLQTSLRADTLRSEDYAAIFFAGGHGTMWDFPDNPALKALTRSIYEQDGIVGAVCHGPAALVNVTLSNGAFLVAHKKLTAFTNSEEAVAQKTTVVPFLLQSLLQERGALFQAAADFTENFIVDGRLVTGQNPASATGVGRAMAAQLERFKPSREVKSA